MNSNHNTLNISQQTLEELIERYFDATTTEVEEECLRVLLESGRYHLTAPVREAMALMSVCAVARSRNERSERRNRRRKALSIAASVAVAAVAAAGVIFGVNTHPTSDVCLARISGVEISDPDAVMNIMEQDLQLMSEISESANLENQLDNFKSIISE